MVEFSKSFESKGSGEIFNELLMTSLVMPAVFVAMQSSLALRFINVGNVAGRPVIVHVLPLLTAAVAELFTKMEMLSEALEVEVVLVKTIFPLSCPEQASTTLKAPDSPFGFTKSLFGITRSHPLGATTFIVYSERPSLS
jgi:hypothetical protein